MRLLSVGAGTLLASLGFTQALPAQQPTTGTVEVTVEESMGMVDGFLVQSGDRRATTDADGRARLVLPAGRQSVSVTRPGFTLRRVTVTVVPDSIVHVTVAVEMLEMAAMLEDVRVTATRIERLAGETPIRVEVIDEMEVDEKTLMAPSGITMLLNETPGLQVQAASPSLGTGSVRILGLPGQYTVMLADGLPLYGSASSALGPLDISPVDLQRVEIIKGAASSLYGGQALGGVINLVSKPPTGRKEILLNRRTMRVTDGATWLSHRLSPEVGVSLLASGTVQGREDVDHDGWADQPRALRWNARPRLAGVDARGRSLFATAGFGYDDREGGTVPGAAAPDGMPFRERLTSRRADVGASSTIPAGNAGSFGLRAAFSSSWRRREFGPGPREDDATSTGFLEVTRSIVRERGTTVLGSVLQLDRFENSLNAAYDHRWLTPSAFVTADRAVGPVTLSASVRGDAHPTGFHLTERLAVLARPAGEWSVRASAGTGITAPTAMNEETEAIGLRAVRPNPQLGRERSYVVMLDVNGELGALELLVTGYGSVITGAIQLADAGDGSGEGILQNAGDDTRVGGVDVATVWRFRNGFLLTTYGYKRGTRPDPNTGAREPVPLLARHRVGADLMIEVPGRYRAGIEGTWYGAQALHDNPFRDRSKPYLYTMAIVARQFGRIEAVANFENLLNVRQSDTHPLVRPTPGTGRRWTTDVWAPLEGFMANVALRYRW